MDSQPNRYVGIITDVPYNRQQLTTATERAHEINSTFALVDTEKLTIIAVAADNESDSLRFLPDEQLGGNMFTLGAILMELGYYSRLTDAMRMLQGVSGMVVLHNASQDPTIQRVKMLQNQN